MIRNLENTGIFSLHKGNKLSLLEMRPFEIPVSYVMNFPVWIELIFAIVNSCDFFANKFNPTCKVDSMGNKKAPPEKTNALTQIVTMEKEKTGSLEVSMDMHPTAELAVSR